MTFQTLFRGLDSRLYTVGPTASFSLVSTDRLEGDPNTFIKLPLLIGRGENKTLSLLDISGKIRQGGVKPLKMLPVNTFLTSKESDWGLAGIAH